MRTFIIVMCCAIVALIVMSVIIFAPEPSKSNIEITRLDVDRQPQPVIQSDPGGENILEFFPEPTPFEQPAQEAAPDVVNPVPMIGEPAPQIMDEEARKEFDRNRLLALIDDWVYIEYNKVGSTKVGKIRQTRSNLFRSISEGEILENDILVSQLTPEAATLSLGESFFVLRRAQEPDFFSDVKKKYRPLTPDEQQLAFDYYMKTYGDKFTAWSKNYKPVHGGEVPRPVSDEERMKGIETYWETYGKQFRKENEEFKPQFNYSAEQKELYEKYWQQYHPDREMPSFEELRGQDSQLGPGVRIQDGKP